MFNEFNCSYAKQHINYNSSSIGNAGFAILNGFDNILNDTYVYALTPLATVSIYNTSTITNISCSALQTSMPTMAIGHNDLFTMDVMNDNNLMLSKHDEVIIRYGPANSSPVLFI